MRVIFIASVLLLILLGSFSVLAHEWYDSECCHEKDCREVESAELVFTPSGYKIGQWFFPWDDGRIRRSKDNKFHICILGQDPICLYRPEGDV